MAQLDEQFYDQLAQRLNKQDAQMDRIEGTSDSLLSMMNDQRILQAAHVASDKSAFRWITWALSGAWAAIGSLVTYLLKH